MKKIKVVILHNILSPHVAYVYKELAKKVDLAVLYCAEKEDNRKWKERPEGFKYKILPNLPLKFKGKDLFTYFINPTIISELSKMKPDVVIACGWDLFAYQIACAYCKLKGIKFILWAGSTDNERGLKRLLSKPLVKLIIKGSDAYIAYGTKAKEYLENLGAKKEKIFISYNTTDINKYKNLIDKYKKQISITKRQLGLEDKKIVMFYGQLIERKGPDFLIKAFKIAKQKNNNLSLLIVGSGNMRLELEALIKKLQLDDVKIAEDPGDEEVCKYYAAADLFVLPSREEVWGLVVNQAMAGALPVIVSDKVGSGLDLVTNDENGYIIPVGDEKILAESIIKILNDSRLQKKFSLQSRKKIKNFIPEKTYINILKSIDFARS